MSGNLWMFSDKLDDEDIEIMKHEFITYYQGADYYGLGLKMFTRLAHEAGAVYKIGKKVLIRRMRSPIGWLSVPGLNVCPGPFTLPQGMVFYACRGTLRSGWQTLREFSMKRMHGLICGVIPPMRTMGTPSRFLHLSCNTVDSGAS